MRRFKNREVLAFGMRVAPGAGIGRKEKRQVGIVGVERPLLTKVELLFAWNGHEERIEQVLALLVQQSIVLGEELLGLGDSVLNLYSALVIDHDRESELTEALALHAHCGERVPQFRDGGGFRIIDQIVLVRGVRPVLKIRDEAGLRIVVMAAA